MKLTFDAALIDKAIVDALAAQGVRRCAFVLVIETEDDKCVSTNLHDHTHALSLMVEAAMVMEMAKQADENEVVGHA